MEANSSSRCPIMEEKTGEIYPMKNSGRFFERGPNQGSTLCTEENLGLEMLCNIAGSKEASFEKRVRSLGNSSY